MLPLMVAGAYWGGVDGTIVALTISAIVGLGING